MAEQAGQLIEKDMVVVILNPKSGGGRALKLSPDIIDTLNRTGQPFFVYTTTGRGDAETRARQFANAGASVVIAAGGDGTINEVANGLLRADRQVPIGLIHAGRGGDMVRSTRTPNDLGEAVRLAVSGTPRSIDVGLAAFDDGSSRYFINIAGLGFDAEVARRAHLSRLPGAQLPYLSSLALSMANYLQFDFSIEVDGETIDQRATFVAVANGQYFGGGFKITPMASIQDGLLDLAIIGDIGRAALLAQLPNVYRGTHIGHPKFMHRTAKSVRVTSREPARVQVDGELVGFAPVTFSVQPGALLLAG